MTDHVHERPGRLRIGVVGAGRVGAVLANSLRTSGHEVVAASGSSPQTLDRIDALLPGVPVVDPDEVVLRSSLVLLTVPDDVLQPIVEGFAALDLFRPGQLVVHTAGRFGVDVLAAATRVGAIPLAIHPAMTFTGTSIDLGRLEGALFAVSAPAAMIPIAQALVVEMGGEPLVLSEEARIPYHAALAHGANHLVTLVSQAKRILVDAGVVDGHKLLAPLLWAALDGALEFSETALTGPIRRGDAGTVQTHLAALAAAHDSLDVLTTYIALARATTARALKLGQIDDHQATELLDVLTENGQESRAELPRTGKRPVIVSTIAELQDEFDCRTRAVVMTMGALHAGHLELVRAAKKHAEQVIVTIFVNRLQFGPNEDLESYPRDVDDDVRLLTKIGVDVVFAPSDAEMYPQQRVSIKGGPIGEVLEGAARPGHFDGMLTIVNKLLNLTRPEVALFGQKDAQQLALIRAMVVDLNMGTKVVAVPTVRDSHGLALSSRNAYLSKAERDAALILPASLRAGATVAADGGGPQEILAAARHAFASHSELVELDYLTLVDPANMQPLGRETLDGAPPVIPGVALLAIAAHVGNTRLIDNVEIDLAEMEN